MSSTQLPKTIMKLKTWNMFTYNKKIQNQKYTEYYQKNVYVQH